MPSTGRMSAFSFTSENSLPSAPVEWMPMARMPASGPMPNGQTRMNASTTCGIERITSSSRRVSHRTGPLRTQVARGRKRQHEGAGEAHHRRQHRHLDRLPQQRRIGAEAIEPVGERLRLLHAAEQMRQRQHRHRIGATLRHDAEQLAEIFADPRQAGDDARRIELGIDGRDHDQQREDHHAQQRLDAPDRCSRGIARSECAIRRGVSNAVTQRYSEAAIAAATITRDCRAARPAAAR